MLSIFQKKIGQVFLKEESDASVFIEKMKVLSEKATGELKKKIDKEIKLAALGEIGENNIAFELKNSGIDMVVLHDIYLEAGNMSAQIDYFVITRKRNYIIECKNLIGDITVDAEGNFVRKFEINGKKIQEGIYSPITQNARHLEVIKEVRRASKTNIITRTLFDNNFDSMYKSLVVLANPKTILNDKYAKKDVKQKIYRADQLIRVIKEMDSEISDSSSETDMMDLGNFFLNASKPNKSDYSKKYEEMLAEQEEIKEEIAAENNTVEIEKTAESKPTAEKNEAEEISSDKKICPKCGAELILRTAKRGQNEGNQFWGCSAFPKCRYIENL